MPHFHKLLPIALATAGFAGPNAAAGDRDTAEPQGARQAGDWCMWMQDEAGTLLDGEENPWLQSLHFSGRVHYQAAYLDAEDVNERDFNDRYQDFRRVRVGLNATLLRFLTADVQVNLVNDGRAFGSDLDWGYDAFDVAILSFDIKKAFDLGGPDRLSLNYGRFKFDMTEEVQMSSNRILTVERSAIANKLYGQKIRTTGMVLETALGPWSGTLGVFSGEDDSDFIGGWNDGQVYYISFWHRTTKELRLGVDVAVNDESGTDDFLGYAWATVFNAVYDRGRFGTVASLVAGENNDAGIRGGSFHGLVLMPYYWLVEKRLQAVLQYQYAGASEAEGMRGNGRYLRGQHSPGVDINDGRGDQLHTLYAGLNYHICGDNLKIMGAVELSSLDTPAGDVRALTYLIAFRTFF